MRTLSYVVFKVSLSSTQGSYFRPVTMEIAMEHTHILELVLFFFVMSINFPGTHLFMRGYLFSNYYAQSSVTTSVRM